jgi:KipI family sensor histidine kinase inhibitor
MTAYPHILSAGDAAVTIQFGDTINDRINDLVLAWTAEVRRLQPAGVLEVVPAYCSATVYFDPLSVDGLELTERLAVLAKTPLSLGIPGGQTIEVPVLYGGEEGPDLQDVADFAGRSVEDTIQMHLSREYRCYMLGFTPGFPYLGPVPEPIALPRLPEPRAMVPAGSVGIAGAQTGIYPQASPGGWRLIGRTPLRLYDPARPRPFLIEPGARVRFRAIDRDAFEHWPTHS